MRIFKVVNYLTSHENAKLFYAKYVQKSRETCPNTWSIIITGYRSILSTDSVCVRFKDCTETREAISFTLDSIPRAFPSVTSFPQDERRSNSELNSVEY